MKFRICDWLNIDTGETLYGIQARMGRGKWGHAIDGKEVLLRKDREDAVKEMERMKASAAERGL